MQSSAVHATAGPYSSAAAEGYAATPSVSNREDTGATAHTDAQHNTSISREGYDPVASSLPVPQTNQGLSTFLAAYGSDSDSDIG